MIRRWLAVPDGQERKAARLVTMIFFFSAALVLMKAAQSGIFLEAFERSAIPWAFAASALTLAVSSSLCVSLAPRMGSARLARATLVVAIVAVLGLRAALFASHAPWVRFAVYVVIEATSGVLVIQIWSAAANACDARSIRRLLPIAGLGAGAAWTIGGFLVHPLAHALGAEELLFIAPALLAVAGVVLQRVVQHDYQGASRTRRRLNLLESWREGFRFVMREPLMRMVAVLALLALLTEQFMDFTLMAVAREELGDAEAISAFYGHYYGVTSAIGMLLLAGVSGRLLSALGATRSLLVTPLAVSVAALVAFLFPSLVSAVAMRGVGRVLKQSIWSSAAEQLQTPLSNVRRSQARSAIRGVLAPLGYACSAVALAFVPESIDTRWLAGLVMVSSALMVTLVLTRARKTYRAALHRALDERRLMLGPGRAPASASLDREACRTLAEELNGDDPVRAELAAEVLGLSDARVATEPLRAGLEHSLVSVRLASVRGLARLQPDGLSSWLGARLDEDEDPDVRRACAEVLRGLTTLSDEARASLQDGERDTDPVLAALCRVTRLERTLEGESLGTALLEQLEARAALDIALSALTDASVGARGVQSRLSKWLESGDPDAKVAVAQTVVRLRLTPLLPDVVRLLKDPQTAAAAAEQLVALGGLEDSPTHGERTLGSSLSRIASRIARGPEAPVTEALVLRLLQHPDDSIRRHSVEALGASIRAGARMPLARDVVAPLLQRDVERAYRLYSILAGLAHDDGVPDWDVEDEFEPLAHEVDLMIERSRRDILALLLLRGRENLVSAVEVGRRRRSAQRDAQVAELLELGLDRDLARSVVPLFERMSLRERVEAGRRVGLLDEMAIRDPLDAILALGDAHLRRAALLIYAERFRTRFPEVASRDADMVPLYERMRFLRSIPLFRDLSGEDVLRLAEKVEQSEHAKGEVIFTKGDPGEDMYLVVRGRVAIVDGGVTLAQMSPPEFFGELALLDHQARSADAVCAEDSALLKVRGADLDELMTRRPGAMREIVRVLAHRLRETGKRLSE